MKDIEKLIKLTYKKAKGYNVKEVTEEYVADADGELKLSKKRVSTKNIPPDMSALRYLLDSDSADKDFADMTDEQLEEEKERLLKLLTESQDS